jgi:hypothetical protein
MSELIAKMRNEIEKSGAISFARFMELALYFPGEGYYERESKIGKGGDFLQASASEACLANYSRSNLRNGFVSAKLEMRNVDFKICKLSKQARMTANSLSTLWIGSKSFARKSSIN